MFLTSSPILSFAPRPSARANPNPRDPNTIITKRLIKSDGTHILSNQIKTAKIIIPYLHTMLSVLDDLPAESHTKSDTTLPRYSPNPIIAHHKMILPIPCMTLVMIIHTSSKPRSPKICELQINNTSVKIAPLSTLLTCVVLSTTPVIPILDKRDTMSTLRINLLIISQITLAMI